MFLLGFLGRHQPQLRGRGAQVGLDHVHVALRHGVAAVAQEPLDRRRAQFHPVAGDPRRAVPLSMAGPALQHRLGYRPQSQQLSLRSHVIPHPCGITPLPFARIILIRALFIDIFF